MRPLLIVLYVALIIPSKLVGRILGRDSLMLRRRGRQSYWLTKSRVVGVQSYFSPGSVRGGDDLGGEAPPPMSSWVAPVFMSLSRRFAPHRAEVTETPTTDPGFGTTREQGIPDEIYTLW